MTAFLNRNSSELIVFGRPFVKRFALCYQTVVLSVCPVLSVCNVGVLWSNGWMIKMKLSVQVGLGPGHNVLDGDSAPPPQRGTAPQFSAHICCGQMNGWVTIPLGMEEDLGPGDFVLDEDPAAPPQKGGGAPNFGPCLLWPNGWMDQDGTWHGDGPRSRPHYARWGPSSPPSKRGQNPLPIFGPFLLWSNGWIKMSLGMEVGLSPGDFVLDGDPAPLP